jgi:hypothetical protein
MGYKALGFIVWQGGKWYARRKFAGAPVKLGVAGLGLAVIAGVVAAGRQAGSSD